MPRSPVRQIGAKLHSCRIDSTNKTRINNFLNFFRTGAKTHITTDYSYQILIFNNRNWYIIAFFSASIILGILYSIIIAIGTIVGLTSYEESENNLLFGIFIIIIWIIELFLFAAVAYWASKGYLPGAMRKKITQDEIEAEKEHAKLEEEQADIMEGLNEKEELSSKEQKQIEKENLKTVKANTFIFTLFGFIVGLIFSLILLNQIVEIIFITLIGSLIGYVFGYLYGESKRKSITKI